MNITSEQLYQLIEVLKNSLELAQGTEWCFKMRRDKRKAFYEQLIKEAITSGNVNLIPFDNSKT